ncbi:MAG: 23S rRNA methyltransferase [Cenarchaeum symbiont of Oopsacas minuta]|nr:23S rRNA methyltransferase [Cenarchaeum symbiont of Oopsacas minuta]
MRPSEAKRDHYRRLAREQGYRSRSAYKLKELNKAYRIIGPGFVILDLGCAPGGWMQVAVQASGNRGRVIGVDTSYVEEVQGAEILRADIEDSNIHEEIVNIVGGKINAMICDLSPQVIGSWSVDHARQISLNYSAAKIMDRALVQKGNALFKVFDGPYSSEFRSYMSEKFAKTKLTKPKASRKGSSEVYAVCLGYHG